MRQKAQEENTHTDYGKLWTRTHRHADGTPTSEAAEEIIDDNFTAVQGPEPVFFRNDAAREFFSLMDESDRPLYQGNVDVPGITSRCVP
ncbi:hypothetical protein K1719_021578 [Acacia pycnantha]|nr:hypothetical protein K1719_021578 [Acacia pycnantha]